jgi:hypothetical protein
MKNVFLTDAVCTMIRKNALGNEFKSTGRRVPGGQLVPLDERVIDYITQHQLDGESFSDTLHRMLHRMTAGLN